MRLRALSEAECVARLYGWREQDRVSVVRRVGSAAAAGGSAGERLRRAFEARLDARGVEPADVEEAA